MRLLDTCDSQPPPQVVPSCVSSNVSASKWYGIYSANGFIGVVTRHWTECNRLVSHIVDRRRVLLEGAVFKSFATEELAREFANNFRDLTVANLSGSSRRNNGAVSKCYYVITGCSRES